jgi:hypothetical protein
MNNLKIQSILHSLKDFSKTKDVHAQLESIVRDQQKAVEKVYQWASPLDISLKIQQTQHDMNQRLLGIETTLPCKVDRSELNELETLATSLRRYDDFIREIDESMKSLQQKLSANTTSLQKHDDHILNLDDAILQLKRTMTSFARSDDFKVLQQNVEKNTMKLESCVHRESLADVSRISKTFNLWISNGNA